MGQEKKIFLRIKVMIDKGVVKLFESKLYLVWLLGCMSVSQNVNVLVSIDHLKCHDYT